MGKVKSPTFVFSRKNSPERPVRVVSGHDPEADFLGAKWHGPGSAIIGHSPAWVPLWKHPHLASD